MRVLLDLQLGALAGGALIQEVPDGVYVHLQANVIEIMMASVAHTMLAAPDFNRHMCMSEGSAKPMTLTSKFHATMTLHAGFEAQ